MPEYTLSSGNSQDFSLVDQNEYTLGFGNVLDFALTVIYQINKIDTQIISDTSLIQTSFMKSNTLNILDSDVQEFGIKGEDSVIFSRTLESFISSTKKETQVRSELLSLFISPSLPSQTLSMAPQKTRQVNIKREESTDISGVLELALSKFLESTQKLSDYLRPRHFYLVRDQALSVSEEISRLLSFQKEVSLTLLSESKRAFFILKERTINYSDLKEIANVFTKIYSDTLSHLGVMRPYQLYLTRLNVLSLADQRKSLLELRKEEPSDILDQFTLLLDLTPFQETLARQEKSYLHLLSSLRESTGLADILLPLEIETLKEDSYQILEEEYIRLMRSREEAITFSVDRSFIDQKRLYDVLPMRGEEFISLIHPLKPETLVLEELKRQAIRKEREEELTLTPRELIELIESLKDSISIAEISEELLRRDLADLISLSAEIRPFSFFLHRDELLRIMDADVQEIIQLEKEVSDLIGTRRIDLYSSLADESIISDIVNYNLLRSLFSAVSHSEIWSEDILTQKEESMEFIVDTRFVDLKKLFESLIYQEEIYRSLTRKASVEQMELFDVQKMTLFSTLGDSLDVSEIKSLSALLPYEESLTFAGTREIIVRSIREEEISFVPSSRFLVSLPKDEDLLISDKHARAITILLEEDAMISRDLRFVDVKRLYETITHLGEVHRAISRKALEEGLRISDISATFRSILLLEDLGLSASKKYHLSRGLEEPLDLGDFLHLTWLKAFSQTLALSDIRRGGVVGPPDLVLSTKMPSLNLIEKIPSIKTLLEASGEKES